MTNNEIFATAAHLHVLLRRQTGRVTDTEWMATNPEYALAMVAYAREEAQREDLHDLLRLADKLASLVPSMGNTVRKPLMAVAAERFGSVRAANASGSVWSDTKPASGFHDSQLPGAQRDAGGRRYVGGIR